MKKLIPFLLSLLLLNSIHLSAANHLIQVESFEFNPQSLTVNVGDTITWVWHDGIHTTTSDAIPAGALPWDQGITSTSGTFSYQVNTPGFYSYHCTLHQSMGMIGNFTATGTTGVSFLSEPTGIFTLNNNRVSQHLQITFRLPYPGNIQLSLMDLSGKKVHAQNNMYPAGYSNQVIRLADLPRGIYLVEAQAAGTRQVARIIIG